MGYPLNGQRGYLIDAKSVLQPMLSQNCVAKQRRECSFLSFCSSALPEFAFRQFSDPPAFREDTHDHSRMTWRHFVEATVVDGATPDIVGLARCKVFKEEGDKRVSAGKGSGTRLKFMPCCCVSLGSGASEIIVRSDGIWQGKSCPLLREGDEPW